MVIPTIMAVKQPNYGKNYHINISITTLHGYAIVDHVDVCSYHVGLCDCSHSALAHFDMDSKNNEIVSDLISNCYSFN